MSFRFVSFRFVSFRFVSFRFVSFRFVSFRFVSFRFVSFRDEKGIASDDDVVVDNNFFCFSMGLEMTAH